MGNRHKTTDLDRARDELMSHVVRCEVLEATMEHRVEWLNDTLDFMAERYPQLGDLQMAQLEMMGRQFIKPAIPHGAGKNAQTLDRTSATLPGAADADETPVDEAEAPAGTPAEPAAAARAAA